MNNHSGGQMRKIISIIGLVACFCLSALTVSQTALAYSQESVGTCFADARCQKPLSDQLMSPAACGRLARMTRHRQGYWFTNFQSSQGYLTRRCNLVYNTVVPPEPIEPVPTSIPLGASCSPGGIPCAGGRFCDGNALSGYYCY